MILCLWRSSFLFHTRIVLSSIYHGILAPVPKASEYITAATMSMPTYRTVATTAVEMVGYPTNNRLQKYPMFPTTAIVGAMPESTPETWK